MPEERVSVAFDKLAQLAIKLGAHPLTKHPNGWAHKIDEHWFVHIAGSKDVKSAGGQNTAPPVNVPAYHAYVEFNGWPAGFINPYGGVIAAGAAANEDSFIAAIDAALAK